MASTDCLSSCSPQPNSQPDPPIAHAPKPTGVIDKSELPSFLVFISIFSRPAFIFERRSSVMSCSPYRALRVTAMCRRKDCRLLADSEQFENAQPHRGLVVRRCRPWDRYNNPVESTEFERL